MTKIGIVYGARSGTVRQIIFPDNDSQLGNVTLQPGEEILVIERKNFKSDAPDLAEMTRAVETFRGKPSEDARCVVIDAKGEVVDVVLADPLIDAHPKGQIVRDANADLGWTQVGSVLTPPPEKASPPVMIDGIETI